MTREEGWTKDAMEQYLMQEGFMGGGPNFPWMYLTNQPGKVQVLLGREQINVSYDDGHGMTEDTIFGYWKGELEKAQQWIGKRVAAMRFVRNAAIVRMPSPYGAAGSPIDPDEFFAGYVACALWSTTDNADDSGGQPLDESFSPDDIDGATLERMLKDCYDFVEANAADLETSGLSPDRAGHDFWLTREGHGAGFWDEGLGEIGDRLTKAAKAYGSFELYVDDSTDPPKVRSS